MMRRFILLGLAVTFAATSCSTRGRHSDEMSAREYEVYSAILDTLVGQGLVGLRDSTRTDLVTLQPLDSIQWRPLRDYARQNEHPALIDTSHIDAEVSFRIVNDSLYRHYFELASKEHDASVVHDHPGSGGILWLSRVGFSPDGDSALVDVQVIDFLHSPTERYLLTRDKNRWQVVHGRVPPD